MVNNACSNVTTDGSIVKWESTTWNPAKLVITKGSQSQTVTLSDNANATKPQVGTVAGDYYFLANGPVYVWDYHLTNYDAAGKVRVAPATTQFSLTNKEQDAIKFYSPDAILKQDNTASNRYKVSGTVELMFNYAKGTDAEKTWVDGITDVDLVSANENNTNLNIELNWQLNKEYQHGTGTVACITVPLGQSNFYSNGRYQLRVTSNGTSKLFPIHVVNEVVPELQSTSGSVQSGDKVYFKVKNMTYGITQPIYRVDLTDPQGNTKTLTKIDDWYLIGDSFILYNDNTNNIPYDGNYTVTVYADGFQQFSKTFLVTGGESLNIRKAALAYGIDTYSGSSLSGGSASSGSGSEGGSNTMNAYIVFDADLLANAEIMTKLDTGNEYASAIAERWAELSHVDVYAKGSSDVYTYAGYADAVNDAHVAGAALTFADYAAKENAEKTAGRPYAVKQVLEDNLLGEATSFSETSNKAVPDIVLVKLENDKYVNASGVTEGQNAMFQCLDKAYLEKLAENGSIYKGTASNSSFTKDTDYTINTEKGLITINHSKLTVGDNSITIQVDGYQTVRLSVPYQKVLEAVKLSAPTEAVALGNPVTITCNAENHKDGVCDFFANVTSVELTGPDGKTKTVLPKGQEGSDLGYEVSNNTLVLCKNQFADTWKEKAVGKYTLTLKAGYGYETQKVEFEIKAKEETPETPPVGDKDVPAYESWTLTRGYFGSGKLCFGASGHNSTAVQPYLNAITAIKLGDVTLTPVSYSSQVEANKYCIDKGTDQTIYFYPADFSITDSTTITIVADGYKDFTLVIGADGKVVTGGDSGTTDPGEGEIKAPTTAPAITAKTNTSGNSYQELSFGTEYANWVSKISGVKISGRDCSVANSLDSLGYGNAYYLNKDNGVLAVTYSTLLTDFPCDMVITVNGGESLTLVLAKNGSTITASVKDSETSGGAETPGSGEGKVTIPTNAPQFEKAQNRNGSDYWKLTFSGNKEWVAGITSVRVGNNTYTLKKSANDLTSWTYYLDVEEGSVGMILSSSTYYPSCDVVISSKNCNDITFVISAASYFEDPTISIKD